MPKNHRQRGRHPADEIATAATSGGREACQAAAAALQMIDLQTLVGQGRGPSDRGLRSDYAARWRACSAA